MPTKVHMEALSPTMEEGQVVSWLKAEGDEVAEGDVLAEIETDKATMELVARGSGVLRKQLLKEGGTAAVGTVIGVIAGADEDISGIADGADAETETDADAGPAAEAGGEEAGDDEEAEEGKEGEEGREEPQDEGEAGGGEEKPAAARAGGSGGGRTEAASDGDGRVKASPLARRLAAENEIELGRLEGSGPGGRIVKRDIEAALEGGAAAAGAGGARPAAPGRPGAPMPGPQEEEVVEVPVSQMRKTIAKRLVTSIGPVPTFYLTIEVDMSRLLEARERVNERLESRGEKVSVNDLIIKATAAALRAHPEVNAAWHETVIERYGRVHIGVAVAVDEGLITPIVRDADRKPVSQIGREVRELAGRAREKKLKPDEYTGATFSISNLGMFGITEFTAIINPPEAGILAVGEVTEKPVVEDGDLVIRPRMRVTMSCDHRVIDGATGARFLQTLREYLEEPVMMLA